MSGVLAEVHPISDAAGFLAGGGEMGALMRNLDWETTPLGPPSRWPVSLQVVVRVLLASREPLAVWWGGGSTLLYNDACRDLIGGPPPGVGAPVPESWIDGSSGLNLSLHPVPGERGQLGGVLCTFAGATRPSA
jgi:hypothetical protein